MYKFIELAPEIFHSIRKMNNVDEKLVKQIFSHDNINNLEVIVTEAKGGTFIIKPKQGGIIIRSINKAEYNTL